MSCTESIKWALLSHVYDLGSRIFMLPFGGEGKVRARFLELAGVSAGQRVLDVGCATGTLTWMAARRTAGGAGQCVGLDLSMAMLRQAVRKPRMVGRSPRGAEAPAFVCADAARLPFPGEAFDRVISFFAVHELDTHARRSAITEFHRVLRPDGYLAVADYPIVATRGAPLLRAFVKLVEPRSAMEILRGSYLQDVDGLFLLEQTVSFLGGIGQVTIARKISGGRRHTA